MQASNHRVRDARESFPGKDSVKIIGAHNGRNNSECDSKKKKTLMCAAETWAGKESRKSRI